MACFAGVAVLGAIPGIALAIMIEVIEFLWDGWRPHSAVLGRVERVKGYHDITQHPEARLIPGLVTVPLGCTAPFRQRRAVPRACPGCRCRLTHARPLAGGRGGAGHERGRHRSRRRQRTRRHPACRRHRVLFRRDEGSG